MSIGEGNQNLDGLKNKSSDRQQHMRMTVNSVCQKGQRCASTTAGLVSESEEEARAKAEVTSEFHK